jgi:hypothetical protein
MMPGRICTAALLVALCYAFAQTMQGDLAFGQVYGTAGFLSSDPSGTMTEAPATVLVFTATDGHRNLTLTQQTGDYIALLEPGRYCLTAYTRAGKGLQLAQNQLKCIDVQAGKDRRLDVMLAARK